MYYNVPLSDFLTFAVLHSGEFTAYILKGEPLDEEGAFVNNERRKKLAAQLRVAYWIGI